MISTWRVASALFVCLTFAACAPSPQEQTESAERTSLASYKAAYPDVVMGFDFHGNTLDVSVDLNEMVHMEADDEEAVKVAGLAAWRKAWAAQHPGQHAKLTVRFLDFQAKVESQRSVQQ
jgi:hypothetical protein